MFTIKSSKQIHPQKERIDTLAVFGYGQRSDWYRIVVTFFVVLLLVIVHGVLKHNEIVSMLDAEVISASNNQQAIDVEKADMIIFMSEVRRQNFETMQKK